MRNASKYRLPPIKRTRDSFIDDFNSQQNPRIDLGKARHTQIRRDKDKVRTLGITIYDIDFAVKSFIDQKMQLRVEDNGEIISIPIIYANPEKWASIQKDGYLKDKKGKTLLPLIVYKKSNIAMVDEMRRNKVATVDQIHYVMKQAYNRNQPYDRFSLLNEPKQKSYEYFLTPAPDYVDVTYDFVIWCEYQMQLNYVIENFVYYTGQSFGDRNFLKFPTHLENLILDESNASGQDRMVKCSFQMKVHGYLLPKDVGGMTTTKRYVTPNKVRFVPETFTDINTILYRENKNDGFRSLNYNSQQDSNDFGFKLDD